MPDFQPWYPELLLYDAFALPVKWSSFTASQNIGTACVYINRNGYYKRRDFKKPN